jgi:hypothetical protein
MAVNLATERSFSYCQGAENVSGPILIFDVVNLYREMYGDAMKDVIVLNKKFVYGVDWRVPRDEDIDKKNYCGRWNANDFDYEECTKVFPDCYAVTVWSHSWE